MIFIKTSSTITDIAGQIEPITSGSDQIPGQSYVFHWNPEDKTVQLVDGIYLTTNYPEPSSSIDTDLVLEFEAWELASDEALFRFEEQLD